MIKKKIFLIVGTIIVALISSMALAAESFYEHKVIRFVVGVSPGGGYDLWTRMIARHINKHIPGNPTIIVENMVGAGGTICANYIYKVAKPDGLTIGHFNGNIFLNQLFKQPGIEFDAMKYEYIGVPYQDAGVVFVAKASGIISMEKWVNATNPLRFGALVPGTSITDNGPRIVRAALGLPVKVVSGYKGTADIRLAIEGGELDGAITAWDSGKLLFGRAMEKGDIVPVLQIVPKAVPEIPHVPIAENYAKTKEGKLLIELGAYIPMIFARPYTLPPGTPKERVEVLRTAFQRTLEDKEFLPELEKAKFSLSPVKGEDVHKSIMTYFGQDPAILAKLKDILYK